MGRRIRLQAHLGTDFLVSPRDEEEPRCELNYAVGLTKTLTEKRPLLSNLTLVIETFGVTQLDGEHAGRSPLSFIPAVYWESGNAWWVGAGIEVPVTGPRPLDEVFHFATFKEF